MVQKIKSHCVGIIQARMGSSRLPGKVLMEVLGRPLLSFMLERVRRSSRLDKIIVATTNNTLDDPLVSFCRKEGIDVFQGSEQDVLDRYYCCARAWQTDVVVRLTADCPLIDPDIIDDVIGVYLSGDFDYVANTVPPQGTYPDGMDVEVFSKNALELAWKEAKTKSDRAHVTFYLWKNPSRFKIHRCDLKESLSHHRLTVDYPQDFELIKKILEGLYPKNPHFSLQEILAFLNAHPQLKDLNSAIGWNSGWKV